jgi:hypothetical protein
MKWRIVYRHDRMTIRKTFVVATIVRRFLERAIMADERSEQSIDAVKLLFATLNYQLEQFHLSDDEILRLAKGHLTEEAVQNVRPHLEQRAQQRALDRHIEYFEAEVRAGLVTEFVQKHVKAKNDYAKQRFAREIAEEIGQGKRVELEPYLIDVLDLGLERAKEKRKRESKESNSRYIAYAWSVLKGLIRIAVVIAVFGIADSKFQTVVFALLIMTYNGLEGAVSSQGYLTLQMVTALNEEFARLRRLMKERLSSFDEEIQSEETQKLIKAANKSTVQYFIHGIFVSITWVIALWKLAESIIR